VTLAERQARDATAAAKAQEDFDNEAPILRKRLQDIERTRDAQLVAIAAAGIAETARLTESLRRQAHAELRGPLEAFRDEPSNHDARVIGEIVRRVDAKSVIETGAPLGEKIVAHALAQVLINERPALVEAFASGEAFSCGVLQRIGPAAAALHAEIHRSSGAAAISECLRTLVAAVESFASNARLYGVKTEHVARFELVCFGSAQAVADYDASLETARMAALPKGAVAGWHGHMSKSAMPALDIMSNARLAPELFESAGYDRL
jgi:hypothetical protein